MGSVRHLVSPFGHLSYWLVTRKHRSEWVRRRFFLLTAGCSNLSNHLWGWALPQTEWGKKRLRESRFWWIVESVGEPGVAEIRWAIEEESDE